MQRLEISTDVYLPREDIYEFLVDFPQYARYSTHLERVDQHGDGEPGTEYDLVFSWWKLSYTARSRVTDVDPPTRIDWRIIKDISARGHWRIETPDETADGTDETASGDDSTDDGDDTGDEDESETTPTSEVYFVVEFEASSADSSAVDVPRFVSFDAVLDRVIPKIQAEATAIVERIVADLEGEPREVELRVHETPSL